MAVQTTIKKSFVPAAKLICCMCEGGLREHSFLGVKVQTLTMESLNEPASKVASSAILTAFRLGGKLSIVKWQKYVGWFNQIKDKMYTLILDKSLNYCKCLRYLIFHIAFIYTMVLTFEVQVNPWKLFASKIWRYTTFLCMIIWLWDPTSRKCW